MFNILCLFTRLGAYVNISQFAVWPAFNNRWSPTSHVFLVEQTSLHLTLEFCFISPTWNSLHEQVPLWNNVCFVDNRVFQQKERSNLLCFPKISKFYFIVSKRFQFHNNTRNLIFISLTEKEFGSQLHFFLWINLLVLKDLFLINAVYYGINKTEGITSSNTFISYYSNFLFKVWTKVLKAM